MGVGTPPFQIKIVLESNLRKSTMLVGGSRVLVVWKLLGEWVWKLLGEWVWKLLVGKAKEMGDALFHDI